MGSSAGLRLYAPSSTRRARTIYNTVVRNRAISPRRVPRSLVYTAYSVERWRDVAEKRRRRRFIIIMIVAPLR